MKKTRKIATLLLAVVMLFSLATTAFAETTGTIKVTGAVEGQTYSIYRILDLEYNESTGAFTYKINDDWGEWVKEQTDYLTVDTNGYVTETEGFDAVSFAALAIVEAENHDAEDSQIAAKNDSGIVEVEFAGLKLGYYLVDSSLGALCGLNTTNPIVEIEEKNGQPTIDKEVKEDSTGEFGEENTAQIGDTVYFKTTVHAKKGAQNYVVHDVMESSLDFTEDSIEIESLTKGTDYTVETNAADGCTFEITFTKSYLDTITEDTDIVITYSAILTEKAEISTDSNDNTTWLEYGEKNKTEEDFTKTYSFKFDIVKTDKDNKIINGAEFELYDAATGGNKIEVVAEGNGVYHIATSAEKAADSYKDATITAGQATIKGMDADTTYYLEETVAPAGYNKLTERKAVIIEKENLIAAVETIDNVVTYQEGGVQVINQTGSVLPGTGGMGTTIFYVIGGVLVLGAVVLLVTRKRMNSAE